MADEATTTISPPQRFTADTAYIAPMATFLLLTAAGGQWPTLYVASYVIKTVIVGAMLIYFWQYFTRIRWDYWWLGIIVGVIGIFQWVPMQLWLQNNFAFFKSDPSAAFNPTTAFDSPMAMWSFIAVRIIGAVIVVPIMEELFWRDYLWRSILAPANFKLAKVGEWAWAPFLIVSIVFATVHGNWWLTAIGWALMIGILLAVTRSIGACIIAHAVTNLLLAIWVLRTHSWDFW